MTSDLTESPLYSTFLNRDLISYYTTLVSVCLKKHLNPATFPSTRRILFCTLSSSSSWRHQLLQLEYLPNLSPLFMCHLTGDLTKWEGDAIVNAANERVRDKHYSGGYIDSPLFLGCPHVCVLTCTRAFSDKIVPSLCNRYR